MKPPIEKKNFTEPEIERIRNLNRKLKLEEERIKVFVKQLIAKNKKLLIDNKVDDFYLIPKMLVFRNNKELTVQDGVQIGNPFLIDEFLFFYNFNVEPNAINEHKNWNELNGISGHSLASEHFCYSMHQLCFDSLKSSNTYFSWNDILDITDVWIEVKVSYQFFADK